MSDKKLRVSGIIRESITDGPGIRFVVFTQGCPFRCYGCHNPQTWDMDGGEIMDCDVILDDIYKNPLVKGVTFSGGEPFIQAGPLLYLVERLKEKGYETAIYTGFLFEDLISDKTTDEYRLACLANVIVDGRFEANKKNISLKFRGSSNQRIIDVKKSLEKGSVVINDTERWNNVI